MIEALRKVKEELGEEAVIIDSGKVREGDTELYEVIAAIEEREVELSSAPEVKPGESGFPFYEELKKELKEIKRAIRELRSHEFKGEDFWSWIKEGAPEDIAMELSKYSGNLKEYFLEKIRKKGVYPLSRIQVFIGEAGVGKTTSLFKIAFWYRYYKKKKVTIVSADNYKVGAKEEAQKLSHLLEMPFLISDFEELQKHLPVLLESQDFIFIDTPSLGKRFTPQELAEVFSLYPSFRFHWVIRSTDYGEYNLSLWEELRDLPIEGVVLTFLDKYIKGARLLWLLREDIPLPHFITHGERIPEDIEKVDEKRLIEIFMRGVKEQNARKGEVL